MKETAQKNELGIRGRKVCDEFIAIVKKEAAELGIAPEMAAILSGYAPIYIDGEPAKYMNQVLKHYKMEKSLKALDKIIEELYCEVLEEEEINVQQ